MDPLTRVLADISRQLGQLITAIRELRFESHQEHQELLRFMDEGPYGLTSSPSSRSRSNVSVSRGSSHEQERPDTVSTTRVIDLERAAAR